MAHNISYSLKKMEMEICISLEGCVCVRACMRVCVKVPVPWEQMHAW